MSKKDDESIDEYLRYVRDSKGIPDDYDDWASDNGIKVSPKKKRERDIYDDSE